MSRSGLLILAGGDNSRLRPLTNSVYKGFLPIHGASVVARHILRASLSGLETVVVTSDEYDPLIHLVPAAVDGTRVEYRVTSGTTASKILDVSTSYPSWVPLLVCMGDTLARVDLGRLASFNQATCDSAMCVARYRLPFGVAHLTNNQISSFVEKPKTEYYINTGYFALGSLGLQLLRETHDLAKTFEMLAASSNLLASQVLDDLIVIDDLEQLGVAHELLDEPLFGEGSQNC